MPAGDITQGYIFVPAEKSIDQVKMNAIVGQAYINPAFISGQSGASSTGTGDYFVFLQSGGTLAKILTQDLGSSLAQTTGFQQQIWSTRLRSFNSVGNCNFECNQRSPGLGVSLPAGSGSSWPIDRWQLAKVGATMVIAGQQQPEKAWVPGTNFQISQSRLDISLQTPQASLASGDNVILQQTVEGPMLRELLSDVHSVSLLVKCTSALKFGLNLISAGSPYYFLSKLCTISVANQWTLIPLPNIPVWPSGGTWATTAGSTAYLIRICLASGSGAMVSANDTWQTGAGGNLGAIGQDNFASLIAGSTFSIASCQHEPGSQCTTLQDVPFQKNYDDCLRYYQKTYPYGTAPGTVTNQGFVQAVIPANVNPWMYVPFQKTMAKIPVTMQAYSNVTGLISAVRDNTAALDRTVTGYPGMGDSGFGGLNCSTQNAALATYSFHYTADTGF
jgi:hypothetical protein